MQLFYLEEGILIAMRILLLSVTNPVPANNGVKMRTWSILKALAADGHEIVLVAFTDQLQPEKQRPELLKICKQVIEVPHRLQSLSSSQDYMGRVRLLLSERPYGVEGARSPEMVTHIAEMLNLQAIDIIFSEQTDLLINLPKILSVPLVVDFHNLDYLILKRYLRFERNPAKQLYAWLESRKVKKWERWICQLATMAMACSEHDKSLLRNLNPQLPLFVVPNIVDTNEYQPGHEEDGRKILFQGGMDWYPNRDAVEFFISKCLPLVQKEVPGLKFVIAGRNPPEEFRRRLSQIPGVEFTGTVADMRAEISSAVVCVVPLRMGSGTRLKILEAAAMAKPVISTRLGAEGLRFINGKEIILEDDPVAFAKAVVHLLCDPGERVRLGRAARERMEQDYCFEALCSAVNTALQTIDVKAPSEEAIAVGFNHPIK